MISTDTLAHFLDNYTCQKQWKDFPGAFNGLQFDSKGPVKAIAAMVDASLDSIQKAVAEGANFVIAHHGLFWKNPCPVVGPLFEKYAFLIEKGCAVYSSHLPLDGHPEIGNNVLIAKALHLPVKARFANYEGNDIGVIAETSENRLTLKTKLKALFPHMIAIEYGPEELKNIAISSGSGAGVMEDLLCNNLNTLVTGELRQAHFTLAQEEGLNLYVCGHYATEVFGVQALAQAAAEHFGLPWHFISSSCPL